MIEIVVQLIANVPVSSVMEVVRAVLKFFLDFDTCEPFLGNQILVQVPLQNLVEIVEDVFRWIHSASQLNILLGYA